MTENIEKVPHGRESYVSYYGEYVLKRPLPRLGDAAREQWLAKQRKTKDNIDIIRGVGNPVYNIPQMVFINDAEYQILEERAFGEPLTAQLFEKLSRRQKVEIVISIANFLVDMNEVRPVKDWQKHKISDEIKFARLDNFINNKMARWFSNDEMRLMDRVRNEIGMFEYTTRPAWSHCDLNPGNVLYDADRSRLSFIDFAEADYHFIYRDIFSPVAMQLGVGARIYQEYTSIHNTDLFDMPDADSEEVKKIMKYRLMTVLLRRFIKAADDLRVNPANEKSVKNNEDKVAFMRGVMREIEALEK
ncbi:aminoglycoside phosphotransferase family protein [bacterium]|nr:aminoglycoside phosphotransferase family protein [bacterium]